MLHQLSLYSRNTSVQFLPNWLVIILTYSNSCVYSFLVFLLCLVGRASCLTLKYVWRYYQMTRLRFILSETLVADLNIWFGNWTSIAFQYIVNTSYNVHPDMEEYFNSEICQILSNIYIYIVTALPLLSYTSNIGNMTMLGPLYLLLHPYVLLLLLINIWLIILDDQHMNLKGIIAPQSTL